MAENVRKNRPTKQRTRAKLFLLRGQLRKSTMDEVIDEIVERIKAVWVDIISWQQTYIYRKY